MSETPRITPASAPASPPATDRAPAHQPRLRPETLAVHAGYDPATAANAAKPPIFMTSTFAYPSAQAAKDIHEAYFDGTGPAAGDSGGPAAHIYTRLGHPGLDMVEARLAALDGAAAAAVFNTGMAAHSAIALAHLRPGDSVVHSRPIYGGTDGLYNAALMPHLGVHSVAFTDGCDERAIRAAVGAAQAAGPLRLIVIETPANPTAALVDIALVVRLAAEWTPRPLVVIDNTLLGPLFQRPIALGVDLCLTSLTKYVGGHSDLLAGGVTGRTALIEPLRLLRTTLGSHLDPFTCWLLARSMETVALRSERAMTNARTIAEFLRDHPKVAGVTYLGFVPPGTPEHDVYTRQCTAAGSTFAFRVHGGEAAAFRFLDALRLLRFAVSLGGSETLITHPATTTHYAVDRATRDSVGIDAATLRLSVGIEHVDDLRDDLAQALAAA